MRGKSNGPGRRAGQAELKGRDNNSSHQQSNIETNQTEMNEVLLVFISSFYLSSKFLSTSAKNSSIQSYTSTQSHHSLAEYSNDCGEGNRIQMWWERERLKRTKDNSKEKKKNIHKIIYNIHNTHICFLYNRILCLCIKIWCHNCWCCCINWKEKRANKKKSIYLNAEKQQKKEENMM